MRIIKKGNNNKETMFICGCCGSLFTATNTELTQATFDCPVCGSLVFVKSGVPYTGPESAERLYAAYLANKDAVTEAVALADEIGNIAKAVKDGTLPPEAVKAHANKVKKAPADTDAKKDADGDKLTADKVFGLANDAEKKTGDNKNADKADSKPAVKVKKTNSCPYRMYYNSVKVVNGKTTRKSGAVCVNTGKECTKCDKK